MVEAEYEVVATRLTLIAHAPTAVTRAAAFTLDEPLDERGLARTRALAGTLKQPERVWTSPARQAQETARGLGLQAAQEPLLADADYGRWADRTFDAIAAEEPDALAAWTSDPRAAPHDGESVVALLDRVGRWIDARRDERGHGLAVTHSAVIRAAVVHAIGAAPQCFWRIDIQPLSLTELRPRGRHWTLRAMGTPML